MQCRACGNEERASEGYPCHGCGTFICQVCSMKGVTLCRPMLQQGIDKRAGERVNAADFRPLGLMVGHATDAEGGTGVTVVRHEEGKWRGGVCIVGRATGTRELNALTTTSLADRVDAVMLTGGSAFGLDAAAGVMRWLEEHKRGHPMGDFVVPIVPAAVIFDLLPLGRPNARPTPDMAYAACDSAVAIGMGEGSVGAGTGATVGKVAGRDGAMKGWRRLLARAGG
jgi:L-aminopeptidase/D-esterase-like protein